MKIRLIKKREINSVSEIVGLNYSKENERRSRHEIATMFKNCAVKPEYLIAEVDDKIVGFAGYSQSWMDYHVYEIFWVNVHPKYQNRGIGTALVKKIIQIIKNKKGKDKAYFILLTTCSPKFYDKLGFKTLIKFKKDYLMIKYL